MPWATNGSEHMKKKTLLLGCGDIGLRLAALLAKDDYELFGLRRNVAALPPHIKGIQWDLNETAGLEKIICGFDVVVITPVPNTADEAGYRRAYDQNIKAVVRALESCSARPDLVILVSSSRVYHQNDGQWVDEDSPCEAHDFRSQSLLAGEKALRASELPHSVVRFSGIYGPGRERMLRQIQSGDWQQSPTNHNYSNRIHSEDCAGVLAHLIDRKMKGEALEDLYLASDCEPVVLFELKQWLSEQMGLSPATAAEPETAITLGPETRGGRRCSNRRLMDSGYRFSYPTFREGYGSLLKSG